jgi:serine/threonine protein kinase
MVFPQKDLSFVYKLADFGLSKQIGTIAGMHERSGSPAYIAPELWFTQIPIEITESFDLFSFGITLYVACTGRLPWHECGDNNYDQFWIIDDDVRYDELALDNSVILWLKALICLDASKRSFLPDEC